MKTKLSVIKNERARMTADNSVGASWRDEYAARLVTAGQAAAIIQKDCSGSGEYYKCSEDRFLKGSGKA
jgi:hypothetical protein